MAEEEEEEDSATAADFAREDVLVCEAIEVLATAAFAAAVFEADEVDKPEALLTLDEAELAWDADSADGEEDVSVRAAAA